MGNSIIAVFILFPLQSKCKNSTNVTSLNVILLYLNHFKQMLILTIDFLKNCIDMIFFFNLSIID